MKNKLIIVFISLAFLTGPAVAKNDKHKGLPPGLEKNQKRGKPLPPGWQKKLRVGHILDVDVYHHARIVVPVDKHGIITVNIDGRLLKLDKVTRRIVDIVK
ncbi:MAG: hypothetical protein PVG75_00515 [Thioalkalispiraceae bacterium]|jgi:hypothetical protein